jgi:hypothetical protein
MQTSQRTWAPSALNTGFEWHLQTWNNCGPMTITTALSYYGYARDPQAAINYLKPYGEDKNVSPHEMVDFVNSETDFKALTRYGGDLDLLRTLVHNQFPVVIERGHMFEGYDWLGHYQNIVGYDDGQRIFYIYDSFLGIGDDERGHIETYDEVDEFWRQFNRQFIVVYEPSREAELMRLLGERADPRAAAQVAFEQAQEEARANREDPYAWFNMGTALNELGRYREAERAFDISTQRGLPWRMLWYQFGLFETFYQQERYDDLLSYINNNLTNGGDLVEETHYWKGRTLEALGRDDQALAAYRQALAQNRNFSAAREAIERLT